MRTRYVYIFLEDFLIRKILTYRRLMRKKYCLFLFYRKLYFSFLYLDNNNNKSIISKRSFLFEKAMPNTHPESYLKKIFPFFFEGFFSLFYEFSISFFYFFSLNFFQTFNFHHKILISIFKKYKFRRNYQNIFFQFLVSFLIFDFKVSISFLEKILKIYFEK